MYRFSWFLSSLPFVPWLSANPKGNVCAGKSTQKVSRRLKCPATSALSQLQPFELSIIKLLALPIVRPALRSNWPVNEGLRGSSSPRVPSGPLRTSSSVEAVQTDLNSLAKPHFDNSVQHMLVCYAFYGFHKTTGTWGDVYIPCSRVFLVEGA